MTGARLSTPPPPAGRGLTQEQVQMAQWYDAGNGQFSVSGWTTGDGWQDVEKGDTSLEASPYDLADVERLTFHYQDPMGNDVYYTVRGPFDDYDGLWDIIEDMLDRYGVAG